MSTAIEIVKEYYDSDEESTRKNAMIALHALGTDEALEELVELAVCSPDNVLKFEAQTLLSKGALAKAKIYFKNQLNNADRVKRRLVYQSINSIVEIGGPSHATNELLSEFTFKETLKNSMKIQNVGKFKTWYRGIIPSIAGALISVIFLTAYMYTVQGKVEFPSALVFTSFLAVPVLCPLVAIYSNNIRSYPSLLLGLIVEIVHSFFWVLTFLIIVFLLVLSVLEGSINSEFMSGIKFTLLCLLLLPMCRIGVSSGSIIKISKHTTLLSYSSGVAFGFLYVIIIVLSAYYSTDSVVGEPLLDAYQLFVPFIGGLSAVYALIERRNIDTAYSDRPEKYNPNILFYLVSSSLFAILFSRIFWAAFFSNEIDFDGIDDENILSYTLSSDQKNSKYEFETLPYVIKIECGQKECAFETRVKVQDTDIGLDTYIRKGLFKDYEWLPPQTKGSGDQWKLDMSNTEFESSKNSLKQEEHLYIVVSDASDASDESDEPYRLLFTEVLERGAFDTGRLTALTGTIEIISE